MIGEALIALTFNFSGLNYKQFSAWLDAVFASDLGQQLSHVNTPLVKSHRLFIIINQ